jgi:hypothetical protein
MLPCLVDFRSQFRHASQLGGLFPFSPYISSLLPCFLFPSSRDEKPVRATPLHSALTPYCLKSFSCNTYDLLASVANKRLTVSLNPLDATLTKNKGVGVSVMVNQKSNKNHCSERPSERGSTSPRPCRGHESKVTSPCVAAFPPECYDLVFHDPC